MENNIVLICDIPKQIENIIIKNNISTLVHIYLATIKKDIDNLKLIEKLSTIKSFTIKLDEVSTSNNIIYLNPINKTNINNILKKIKKYIENNENDKTIKSDLIIGKIKGK